MTSTDDFRAAATAFLSARFAPTTVDAPAAWGDGDDDMNLLDGHADPRAEADAIARARQWRAEAFDAGFVWPSGPVEYGGGGGEPGLDELYRELETGYDVPPQNVFATGSHLIGPALVAHGSDWLKGRYLRALMRGDLLSCQLLSEPGAGSDLAGLTTRAERTGEGDDWIVNGQKVWTSYGHLAQVGQLLARTDPAAPKHRGLTMFLIDMDWPGVEVRPLRQMTGETHFSEVFLTDVRVPDSHRCGPEGAGWAAVMATLMSERASVGSGATNRVTHPVDRAIQLARHRGCADDPVVRQGLARAATDERILGWLAQATEDRTAAGIALGPEGSIAKLVLSRHHSHVADLAAGLLGPAITADTGEWGTWGWLPHVLGAPMMHIAGGTDEIQRNILAERVLGLPKEPS